MHRRNHAKSSPVEVVRPEEFEAMIAALDTMRPSDVRARLMLALMYYAGLRRSEVTGLARERCRLDGDDPRLELRKTKFDKWRNVPLDARILPFISAWDAVCAPRSPWLVHTYHQTRPNAVARHPAPPGSQLKVNAVWNSVRVASRRAGITRNIRPHMFRHAAATNWMQAGLSLREVQYLLGHQNIQTTQRYLHVHDDEIAKKVYALSDPQLATPPIRSLQPTHRDCPWCAEPIRQAAIVCRWCGRDAVLDAAG